MTIIEKPKFYYSELTVIERYLTKIFYFGCFFVIFLLTQSLVLTLLGVFISPLVSTSLVISFILAGVFLHFLRKDVNSLPNLTVLPVLIIILVLSIFILFPHDTFGGRDEALYANLAVYLAEHGSTKLPSYLSNLPSSLAKGTEARLPAYTSWLAMQKMFFGSQWLLRSNAILVGLGLCSLFLVALLLGGRKTGLMTIILYVSSMPFLWFSRETMTENLSFFLFWFLVLFLLTFLRTKNCIYLPGLFFAAWLLAFTRIEGFFIQFSFLLALLLLLLISKITTPKKSFFIVATYLLFICSNVLIIKSFSYESYLVGAVTGVKSNIALEVTSSPSMPITENVFQKLLPFRLEAHLKLYEKLSIFYMTMLGKYNFILVIFSIFYPAILLAVDKKKSFREKTYILSLFIIIAPEFYKFLNPSVTIDQPWMYRRYVYAILPMGYLSLSMLINRLGNRRLITLLFCCVFLINLILSYKIIFLKNNWLLVNKMGTITKNVSQNDYVIIRNWTLNYYYPGSFLIIQKGIRSSFSTEKISEFLPQQRVINGVPYNKLYLLSNKEDESYPNFRVIEKDSIKVEYEQLQPSCELNMLGEYLRLYNVYDYSMIPYSEAVKYCSQPENEIKEYKERLFLYELIYEK